MRCRRSTGSHSRGEQRAVGLHGEVDAGRHGPPEQRAVVVDPGRAGEGRLAAVQHDQELLDAVGGGVRGDAPGRGRHNGYGHEARLAAPRLVGVVVDVAVVAVEVAPAGDLEDERGQRRQLRCGAVVRPRLVRAGVAAGGGPFVGSADGLGEHGAAGFTVGAVVAGR
jgi:hypothetical protein